MKFRRFLNRILSKFGLVLITKEHHDELMAWADYGQQGSNRFFGKEL